MPLSQDRLKELLEYFPLTGEWRWRVDRGSRHFRGRIAGSIDTHGYRQVCIDGVKHLASRLAVLYMTGVWPENEVDHINLDTADDKWMNLRVATRSQNVGNQRAYRNNRLGVKGVYGRYGKYYAQIQVGGKQRYLGSFFSIEEAKNKYREAAEFHFGEFARME